MMIDLPHPPDGIKTLHYEEDVAIYSQGKSDNMAEKNATLPGMGPRILREQNYPRNVLQIPEHTDSTTAIHPWKTYPSNGESEIPGVNLRHEAHLGRQHR
ncbi:hypothetical protein OUZ56_005421 [Daphnia magna]|uniref:Uncharacterized protein n=1 Tax=Daphnia magna TaxID=35525 RepID=A0ABQ9YSS9_9CRUS|nr:hypothetical protein OUZ56_005421 [Daphnia magna]